MSNVRVAFICSAGHAGSTLLDLLLGANSAAVSLGEITHLPKNLALNTPCTCVVTARRSIGSTENAVRVTTRNYDYYFLCPELRRKRMIPLITRIRAKSVGEFGALVHHSGEEFIYVIEGRIEVHTEFYDPVTIEAGESIYIDSTMGHAYLAAEGCEEATVLGVCSSAEEGLMESLMGLHGDAAETEDARDQKVS